MPLSVTDRPATTRAPPGGAPMKERTVMRVIGTVLFGAVPGSTQPHGVSGIRYAGFIQNFSKTWSITEISERFLDRKSTRLNSSHTVISYAVFCLKKKK